MSAGLEQKAGAVAVGLSAPATLVPPLRASQPRGWRDRLADLRLEQFVMGAAIIALCVLVVLPLLSLFYGSLQGEEGASLSNFTEALSSRLYLTPLFNSLVLGAWVGLFSILIGVPLA